MDFRFSIASSTLRVLVNGIALLTELTLFTSPWIVGSAPEPGPKAAMPLPPPAFTSAVYAVTEPIYVALVAKSGIAPWILLMNTLQHIWVCEFAAEFLVFSMGKPKSGMQSSKFPPKDVAWKKHANEQDSYPQADSQGRKAKRKAYVATFFPVHSAAASNANFLLFAATLDASFKDGSVIFLALKYFVFAAFLGSKFGDYVITQLANKTPIWKRQLPSQLREQCGSLALILSIKVAVRMVLGQSAFPMLQIMGSGEMLPAVADESPPWLAAIIEWKAPWPQWVNRIWPLISILLQAGGFYLCRKGLQEEDRAQA